MNKKEIRKQVKTRRLNRTLKDMLRINDSIRKQLIKHVKARDYHSVLIYLSTLDKGEIDTWNIINDLKGYDVYTPKIGEDDRLQLIRYNNTFSRNSYGILECLGERQFPDIDIAIIPMLAFDMSGNRIGFGRGYFDALLGNLNVKHRVGLCADPPHSGWSPEPHDIAMNCVVTPLKVYEFN